jgi:hypothetical protein
MSMKQNKFFGANSVKIIKDIIISHAVLLTLFGGIAFAFAQNQAEMDMIMCPADARECPDGTYVSRTGPNCEFAACSGETNERKRAIDDEQDRRPVFEKNLADRKAALTQRAQERFRNLAANLSNRMDTHISRLLNITERLESRMEKLEGIGVDTSEAKKHTDDARVSLNNALATITTIDTEVHNTIGSENPQTGWKKVKSIFADTHKHLREAKSSLHTSVATLKTTTNRQGVGEAVRNQNDPTDNQE